MPDQTLLYLSRHDVESIGLPMRTIAINLGLALEDMATAMPIYQAALQQGLGVTLPL